MQNPHRKPIRNVAITDSVAERLHAWACGRNDAWEGYENSNPYAWSHKERNSSAHLCWYRYNEGFNRHAVANYYARQRRQAKMKQFGQLGLFRGEKTNE